MMSSDTLADRTHASMFACVVTLQEVEVKMVPKASLKPKRLSLLSGVR